ncbi:aminotransferase class V-fold PLP-dependent enzyme [Streptomyces sp. CSDS2]|uniref:pyridoxal phosphate-dependent decarboxylase family protein n=1 Tax=Streptomyces sp. CSDS2 TaxID=3055051 RepID=UPI0025AEF601|nr:aminotransferase class V-fold PLP-dependent enzyme [Streptomyces sp. CSDS2]MDN3260392.1 aminotransferase class V-fold PLP-dependent enzyme [Streptomyces sp. CSDS2]
MAPLDAAALAGSPEGVAALRRLVDEVLRAAQAGARRRGGPVAVGGPAAVAERNSDLLARVLPLEGLSDAEALVPLAEAFAWGSVDLASPSTAAFLQCPPLTVAAAADLVVSTFNQSVDVCDSGPCPIELEKAVFEQLRVLTGLPEGTTGVMTPGGSIANLLAVIIARDVRGSALCGVGLTEEGSQAAPRRLQVVCSRETHVSVDRAIAAAGLGNAAAVVVETGADGRMTAGAVRAALTALPADHVPFALLATAGTTDLGAIDDLPDLAELAHAHGMWFHVDAAYGAGMLFSPRMRPLFTGIEQADSLTLDLHKFAWQPASSSVLMVRDGRHFRPLQREAAYLNPRDDEQAGLPNQLGHTLETTRRADVLKVAASFRYLGRRGMAELIDHCHTMARHAERLVAGHPRLRAAAPVVLTRLVFRHLPRRPELTDQVNAGLRRRLLTRGSAVIGRTTRVVEGAARTHLKLTVINPMTTAQDIENLIAGIVAAGEAEERAIREQGRR